MNKTNDYWNNPPDDGMEDCIKESELLFNELKGYGRLKGDREILFHGKDADLDSEGQCILSSVFILDRVGKKNLIATMTVSQYATICPPDDEKFNDLAFEMVCDVGFSGEWTGEDWSIVQDNYIIEVEINGLPGDDDFDLGKVAKSLVNKLSKYKNYKTFCKAIKELNKNIDSLK